MCVADPCWPLRLEFVKLKRNIKRKSLINFNWLSICAKYDELLFFPNHHTWGICKNAIIIPPENNGSRAIQEHFNRGVYVLGPETAH